MLKLKSPIATLHKNEARIQLPKLTKSKSKKTKATSLKRNVKRTHSKRQMTLLNVNWLWNKN